MVEELNNVTNMLSSVCSTLKTAPSELEKRIHQTLDEMKTLRQENESLKAKEAVTYTESILKSAKSIDGLSVIAQSVGQIDAQALRAMGDWLRDKDDSVVALLAATSDDKITFLATCGKKAIERGMHSGNLVRRVSSIAGGKGGGRPDSAMGGGKELSKVEEALAQVELYVRDVLAE